ncbi:E3 ubiquitin-protein ligase Kcmf1 isoform X2 [Musca domestica]|uniref:RING-type E3 ubiquitin transferase n=1 Tax=Musca domestica TaxID=7370 RepID=A0A9J7D9B5_MUSDO|nr:E3 ubiquitin-protein ligase Kcmf1 isoform X2 [Musca domestica]
MSRHEGVSCDSCLKSNFNGRRYKCLICYDYDLCADCYEEGVTSTRHLVEHPMQCILTRSDIELFFGGEMLNSEQPQSFTCPYCKKMGFSDATLLEHVSSEHTETSSEVVCPVCAGLPGGEPNLVTDDFAGHLSLEHRTGPRELISFLDEPSAIRHGGGVRRIPGRTLGGPRARRSNMHFSSSSGLSALSPSGRESVDPIAELLSQLSGVRRGGPPTSQLQQLQMQIQLERQQATRQQLERLPRRAHPLVSSSNSNATMAEVISGASGGGSGSGSGLISGSGSGSNANGGGSGSSRTNEWSVSAQHQSQQSSLAANALNTREVTLNSSNYLSFNDFGLSPQYSSFLQPGGSGGISGSNGNSMLGMSIAGGSGSGANAGSAAAGGASGNGSGADGAQSQFLLTKFMQPTLSDAEWAEIGRERADRSQFVQALLLSTLACTSLDLDPEHDKRGESQETTNSDNVNNEKAASAAANNTNNTANDSESSSSSYGDNTRETMMNNNAADASAQTTNTTSSVGGGSGTVRQQVHQQQQTSPEDFVVDDLKQQQQQAYSSKKKSAGNATAGIKPAAAAGGAATDRGIERRGRPPPQAAGGVAGAAATGSQAQQQQQQQQQGQQPQKYKQNAAANAAAMSAANTNQIPDTR